MNQWTVPLTVAASASNMLNIKCLLPVNSAASSVVCIHLLICCFVDYCYCWPAGCLYLYIYSFSPFAFIKHIYFFTFVSELFWIIVYFTGNFQSFRLSFLFHFMSQLAFTGSFWLSQLVTMATLRLLFKPAALKHTNQNRLLFVFSGSDTKSSVH